jgi:hypothetical protein
VPNNIKALNSFRTPVTHRWHRSLRRQRTRKLDPHGLVAYSRAPYGPHRSSWPEDHFEALAPETATKAWSAYAARRDPRGAARVLTDKGPSLPALLQHYRPALQFGSAENWRTRCEYAIRMRQRLRWSNQGYRRVPKKTLTTMG